MSVNQTQVGASSLAGTKRRRARRACIPCRQRKRKCDGTSPCEMCNSFGYACQYDDDDSPLAPFVARPAKRAASLAPENVSSPGSESRCRQDSKTSTLLGTSPDSSSSCHRNRKVSPSYETGLLDENKSRFVGVSSATAFPRLLGLEIQSADPPALHSIGFNFGIRPEQQSTQFGHLSQFISETEVMNFAAVFFKGFSSIYDVIHQELFNAKVHDYYSGKERDSDFAALVAGVVAVGSYLSTSRGHPREFDIARFAKTILEDSASTRKPAVDQIVAWLMRLFYVRATEGPNNAWLASSTVMLLIEALGIHEEENVIRLARNGPIPSICGEAERLRRIFWMAHGINAIISYEYGRSPVRLNRVSCENVSPSNAPAVYQQVRVAQIIPSAHSPWTPEHEPADFKEDMYQRIKALREIHVDHPFVLLTRADITFCIYRRLQQRKILFEEEIIDHIIFIGNTAMEAASMLAKEGAPFWNMLGSAFQYTCVLLAIDTRISLANVENALATLKSIAEAANSTPTREAFVTARLLFRDVIKKKKWELSVLETVESGIEEQEKQQELANIDLPPDFDLDLDWDEFFADSYRILMGENDMFYHPPNVTGKPS